jgi:hypothetical protein
MVRKSILIFFLIPLSSFCQDKGDLSFEFNYNAHNYSMNKLNEFLIDTNYNNPYLYSSHPTEQIKKGNGYSISLGYQPLEFVDFGIYGSFQFGRIKRHPQLLYTDPVTANESYYYGDYLAQTSAFGVGLTSSIYINRILNFEEKQGFIKGALIALEFQGGLGYSHFCDILSFPDYPDGAFEFKNYNHKSTDFQGQVALKLGYSYKGKNIKSSFGVKFGYQFYKTATVENSIGKGLKAEGNINLDFSGFFIGTFIKLGK